MPLLRRPTAHVVAVAGAAIVVVGAFLPWVISGQASRNSFTTVQSARSLDLTDSPIGNGVLATWYLVPLLAAVVLLLAVLDHRRALAIVAATLGAAAILFGAVVWFGPIPSGVGSPIAISGGVLCCFGSVSVGRARRRSKTGGPDPTLPE